MDTSLKPNSRLAKLPKPIRYFGLALRQIYFDMRNIGPEYAEYCFEAGSEEQPNLHTGYNLGPLKRVGRISGNWNASDLQILTALAKDVPGDFMEIGVYQGDAFSVTTPIATAQGKHAHAVDSFEGLPPRGERDTIFNEGEYSAGGLDNFKSILAAKGIASDQYSTWKGWIPEVLDTLPTDIALSFALIDLDYYAPTVASIGWVWPRLSVGGLCAFDDFYLNQDDNCSGAINAFLREANDFEIISYVNGQFVLRKVNTK